MRLCQIGFLGSLLWAVVGTDAISHAQRSQVGEDSVQSAPTDQPSAPRALAETELFGLVAQGSRFVYVLDRSASMADLNGRPLRALKRELRHSLEPLTHVQEFQLVFYNHRPRVLQLDSNRGTLLWADEANKRRAARFVDAIRAEGGTDHMSALKMGLAMSPDALFFLTDADRPQLDAGQLDTLQRLNAGTCIFAIELGKGQEPTNSSSFLRELAEQSGGRYLYLDVLSDAIR